MAIDTVQTLANDVKAYSALVAKHGPNCAQTKALRKSLGNDSEFLAFADSLDKIARKLASKKRRSSWRQNRDQESPNSPFKLRSIFLSPNFPVDRLRFKIFLSYQFVHIAWQRC